MKIVTKLENDITDILVHMKDNNPIVIPTDTNYNLACFPTSEEAIDKIFTYKQRPRISRCHYSSLIRRIGRNMGYAKRAAYGTAGHTLLPGPFNIIVD